MAENLLNKLNYFKYTVHILGYAYNLFKEKSFNVI